MRHLARITAFVGAIALVPAFAWASPWHWGIMTGLSLTSIHGDFADIAEPKSKLGFQGGGLVEFAPGPVAVGVEVMYVRKGTAFDVQETDMQGNLIGTFESRLQLDYLEIPVVARASLPHHGPIEPYVVLGPTFGIAVKGTFENDAPGYGSADVGDDLKPLDVGMTGGLGVRIGSGFSRFGVEARYSTGFTDLWDVSQNLESINHGVGLSVAWIR